MPASTNVHTSALLELLRCEKSETDAEAIMANRWIPSKVSLDRELPVMPKAPFASVRQNYRTADEKHLHPDVNERIESEDLAINASAANGCGKFIDESSSLVSPMRINHRAQIDVIDISEEESSPSKYILIYEEQYTKFVILKALKSTDPSEVASELSDIVATVGGPRIIQSGNGREYAEQVVREIRLLLRDFCVVHGDSTKNSEDRRDFKLILRSWMNNNPGRNFRDALRIVQITENTKFDSSNGKAPSQLFFGGNICEDLRRTIGVKGSRRNSVAAEEAIVDSKKNDALSADSVGSSILEKSNESPIAEASLDKIVSSEKKLSNQPESCFACKICGKRYRKLGHLRNHAKTHARTNNFPCNLCQESFKSCLLRDRHERRFHRTEKSDDNDNKRDELLDRSAREMNRSNFHEREKKAFATGRKFEMISTKRKNETRMSLKSFNKRSSNGDNLLECAYCQQKFNFPSVLKRHVRCHTNERPYACQSCDKTFKQLGHLSQHSLTHADYRAFRCPTCSSKFETLESLNLHAASHHDPGTIPPKESYRLYECDVCKKVFTTKSVLERHVFTHTHERKFGCKICSKRFKQASHVKSHMLVHTGERKFSCNVCAKRFSLSNSLKKHMYVHNGEKPYQCDICGSRFLEKRNLNSHLMTHTNERPFSCKICGKRYTLVDTLRRHVSAAHEDGRIYQCEICAKMFKQLAHLSVHKKVHTDERPFQCHLCEKNFKHKNVLKSHLAIHANVRAFECDACKATFVRKTNLQTHIASAHMNERPYVCSICDKRFKQISHLNGHIIVHSNSMPYQCDYCDRRCNRLDNLKKHMRLHAKDKE